MRRRKFKIKITEIPMSDNDRETLIKYHKHIKELSNIHSKDKMIQSILKAEIQNTRAVASEEFAHKWFKVSVFLGPHRQDDSFPYYPKIEDITMVKDSLIKRLSKDRDQSKRLNYNTREFNGMQYTMVEPLKKLNKKNPFLNLMDDPGFKVDEEKTLKVFSKFGGGGRVFNEPNSIIKLLNSESYTNRIRRAKKPYDKSKYVGVELELIARVDINKLNKLFVDAKLAGSVYVKHDGSLRADSGDHFCHEITLIAKQDNINNVISRVCAVLNSKEVDAYVNDTCGLHVHLDMRSRDPNICYNNLFYSLNILKNMVPYNRTDNNFCVLNNTNNLSIAASTNANPQRSARYQAINAVALSTHSTLEVRLHSGSTNANKINNWVNILVSIVERKDGINFVVNQPEELNSLFGLTPELIEYINKRIDKFKDKKINNKQADLDQAI